MIIQSHHGSAALASRKRRELEKRYYVVRLLSRRNGRGQYSASGHTFVWEVFNKESGRTEFVVHFDYGGERGKNLIRFQVHVIGPEGATDEEAISAIRKFERGEKPKAWKWKEIYWAHPKAFSPQGPIEEDEKAEELLQAVRRGAIGSPNSVSVARKNTVRINRRTKRKTKRKKGNA